MPIASDQPFTLEACYRAGRVSVLADYDYYFAVRRLTATNITYLSQPLERLRTAEAVLSFAAKLIEPGSQRDAVLLHYFDHNVAKLLGDDFLHLARATQQRLHEPSAGSSRRTSAMTSRRGWALRPGSGPPSPELATSPISWP